MLAIVVKFPAGRYHATPWGRHVNEADVEWPPAPWRILRALIATWHRKMDSDDGDDALLEELIEKLASELPVYHLPAATRSHSRHYMPVRQGKKDKPVLIFDAFVRIGKADPLVVCWPNVRLDDNEKLLLNQLLRNLGFLGRAESWVEVELLENWDGDIHCRPSELSVDTDSGEISEPISLIAPVTPEDYATFRRETIQTHGLKEKKLKKAQNQVLATLPERFLDVLRLETAAVRQAGWSCAPGARFVTYQRPYHCFRPQPRWHRRRHSPNPQLTTARLALAGRPLPKIQDAIRIGELIRNRAMKVSDRLSPDGVVPNVLSGHDMPEGNRHGHAFYLPEDADNDGHIDHILIHAESGLAGTPIRALDRITRLWFRGENDWQVILEQYGKLCDIQGSRYVGKSRQWISVTPYLHPWFRKSSFTVEDQIRRECRERGLLEPQLEPLDTIKIRDRDRRPVHFHRFRSKRGMTQPDRQGSFWRLSFPESIGGPLALGFGCHYGLGIFRSDN